MSLKPSPASDLAGQRLLVWGLGAEGRSTLAFLERFRVPIAALGIMDRDIASLPASHFPEARRHAENELPGVFAAYDRVIKGPGIPTARLPLSPSDRAKITCQTELFLRYYPGTVIGITGTKGKSTTSKLVHTLLAARDPSARLAGNIGIPVLDLLDPGASAAPAPPVICEMSSYQLEYTRTSPPVAVLLNLYQDHLDFHGGFGPYTAAKWNIARHQKDEDHLILPASVPLPPEGLPPSTLHRLCSSGPLAAYGAAFKNGSLFLESEAGRLEFPLPPHFQTRHAREHLATALTVAHLLGVPAGTVHAALPGFCPLPHRLQNLGAFAGITFHDDSIATIPEAAISAIESLSLVHTLITGGKDRGIEYSPFADYLATGPVRHLILMPETGSILERLLAGRPHPGLTLHRAETLEEAVALAFRHTPPGRACLLSPAASSYNTHRNYEEKSRDFLHWIRALSPSA